MSDTSDPLEILNAIDRERGESFIGMIQANQVQQLRDEIVALRAFKARVFADVRDEALEEAAQVCDQLGLGVLDDGAAAIRALKNKAEPQS